MNRYVLFLGLIISIGLNIAYRFKCQSKIDEKKWPSALLDLNIVGYLFAVSSTFISDSVNTILISTVITRFYLLYILAFLLLFMLRMIDICYEKKEAKVITPKKLKNFSVAIFYLAAVAMVFMSLNFYGKRIHGMAVDFVYLCHVISMFIWLLLIIKNSNIDIKKFIPTVTFVLLATLLLVMQKYRSSIEFMALVHTIVLAPLVYFETSERKTILPKMKGTMYNTKAIFSSICASRGKEVIFNLDEGVPENLIGDVNLIDMVCKNLLNVAFERSKNDRVSFSIDSVNKNDICKLIIVISTNDGGFEKEKLDAIFTANVSEDATIEAIINVKKNIDELHGKFIVQSEVGAETKFIVALKQGIVNVNIKKEV